MRDAQEAIAHAEAAEADNDRLSDTIQKLEKQLAQAKAEAEKKSADDLMRQQV